MALRITLATGQQHVVDFNHESTLTVTNMGQAEPGAPLSERTQAWTDIVGVETIAQNEAPEDAAAKDAATAALLEKAIAIQNAVDAFPLTGGITTTPPQSEPPAQPEADIQPPPDGDPSVFSAAALQALIDESTRADLNARATALGVTDPEKLPNKQAVVDAIVATYAPAPAPDAPAADSPAV